MYRMVLYNYVRERYLLGENVKLRLTINEFSEMYYIVES